ncbi:VWA domain-containing protein [Pelagibius sp. 7325]|uniref:VWA domain-containing protein n=1 Tax=Pelagibius sp. 7325 TaxID=3131994 RepID=UPI0030EBFC64
MVKTTFSGEAGNGDVVRTIDCADQSEIVLDAGLLFSADFVRLGDDLLLQGADGSEVLLRDYFTQVPPPPLETAEGARLTPDTVESLAGPAVPLSFAQLGDAPLSAPIGAVSSLNGIARVQRADGVRDDLHEGDPIFLGDVVSTGVGSDLGILFVDDTVFSLSANARMVVDELIYNPGGAANTMGVSLIQGTFVFVTGNIAPSGEMNVDTPAGTIGIRGTTVGVRIGTLGGVTRIVNIENPETGEVGRFTFSNFGGSAQFTQANHFLEIRSADIIPGLPATLSSEALGSVFGRPLNNATEIQRNIEQNRTEGPPTGPDQQQAAAQQPPDNPVDFPFETAAGPQPLGGGSSFAAGLTLGANQGFGLVANSLPRSDVLTGVDISGFGPLGTDNPQLFRFFPSVLTAPPEEIPPAINVVYLIDISGSMSRGADGRAPTPSSPSRIDLAKQAVLALNQQLIDAGVADRVSIKVIAFRAHTDIDLIESRSAEFDGPDDAALMPFIEGLQTDGGTEYEGPLQVAVNWLHEDIDPGTGTGTGTGTAERYEDALNFIYLFSDGGEEYLPDAALSAELYDDGSGAPILTDLTIQAFAIGAPGADNFSTDQLGKVETGSLGNGGEVDVISDTDDIAALFPGAPPPPAPAAPALQLAALVDDPGEDLDALLPAGDSPGDAAASEPSGSGATSALFLEGGPPVSLNPEDFTPLA